jgi:hypothetical protein
MRKFLLPIAAAFLLFQSLAVQPLLADNFSNGIKYLTQASEYYDEAKKLVENNSYHWEGTSDISIIKDRLNDLNTKRNNTREARILLKKGIEQANYGSDAFNIYAIGAKGSNREAGFHRKRFSGI